jgi:ribosomal protein S12 methylthiotransferase accessory factor
MRIAASHQSPKPLADVRAAVSAVEGLPCGLARLAPSPSFPPGGRRRLLEIAVARFALPETETVSGGQTNWVHGTAAAHVDAEAIAVIEALERYSGLGPPTRAVRVSYRSVANYAVLPTDLPLFSEAQYRQPGFPYRPFDPDEELWWSWGYHHGRRQPVLVPSSAAWYGYDDGLLGETSNGVAAHSAYGAALLNGVLELVERDAFMIHWLNHLSPPRIAFQDVADEFSSDLVRAVQATGYTVHLLDITTDLGIPVMLAIGIRSDRSRPALILGAGASARRGFALRRALSELYAATFAPTALWRLPPPLKLDDVHTLADHSRAYAHPAWLQHAAFLWESDRQALPTSEQVGPGPGWHDDLVGAMGALAAHGHDVVSVDITAPELVGMGIVVVRAIVPGLQPLAADTAGRLGGQRLYEAPLRMGYRDRVTSEAELNHVPHCFP